MDVFMEKVVIGLLISLIPLSILGSIWVARMISASNEERRSTDRRLRDVETELKDLRKVYVSLGKIDTNIEHILEQLHDAAGSLVGLSSWQKERESAIDEAVQFIREARADGIRSKT